MTMRNLFWAFLGGMGVLVGTQVVAAPTDLLDSSAFDYRYEFDLDPADWNAVDLDGNSMNDWDTDGTVALDAVAGTYTIGPDTAGGSGMLASRAVGTYWSHEGNIWPTTAVPPSAGPFTIEIRAKVLRDDDATYGAMAMNISGDSADNGCLFIKGDGQRWGSTSSTSALIDPFSEMNNNTNNYHTFRIAMESTDAWWVWRDGVLLNPGGAALNKGFSHPELMKTFRLGDLGSVVDGQAVLDYVRFTEGAYAPDTLKFSGIDAGEQAGAAVAIDGDILAIGAPLMSSSRGRVYVCRRATDGSGNWIQEDRFRALDVPSGGEFGYSLAMDGETILVGTGNSLGKAYLYQWQGGEVNDWMLIDTLAGTGSNFGFVGDISGDTAIVGQYSGSSGGKAFLYQDDGAGDWDTAPVVLSSSAGYFGTAVALDGDTAVVGALGGEGQVFIYGRDEGGAGNWGLVETLTGSWSGEQFGRSVALDGDTLVIGADKWGDENEGAAYLYQRDGLGSWNLIDTLLADDAASEDRFGSRLAVSGDKVIISTRYGDDPADAGAAYLFGDDGTGDWQLLQKIKPEGLAADDQLGTAVAIDGDDWVVGAVGDDPAGAVYMPRIFQTEEPPLNGDLNGDGFVGGDDLDIVRSFWGQNVETGNLLQGDPSGDGFVGGDDLDVVRANWGQGEPPAPSAVPEPHALALLLAGALAVWFFRR